MFCRVNFVFSKLSIQLLNSDSAQTPEHGKDYIRMTGEDYTFPCIIDKAAIAHVSQSLSDHNPTLYTKSPSLLNINPSFFFFLFCETK